MQNKHSVKKVSELSGVSIRALHHYDSIGLLVPAERSEKNYRHYDEQDLLRLQQILFHRELGFTLEQTRKILDDPDFDYVEALRVHRKDLIKKHARMERLIQTLEKTLESIEGEQKMTLKNEDLYKGFDQETIDRWNREVDEKYDPEVVAESRRNVGKMSKDRFKDIQEQGDLITASIAALMDRAADDPEVQKQIERHHAWIENFYVCPAEMYKGLGQLYVENPEFTAFYEKFKPGLAAYMAEAMTVFADESL